MLGGTDIYKVDSGEADPALNVRVIRPYNKRQYDNLLKVEATKRVCLGYKLGDIILILLLYKVYDERNIFALHFIYYVIFELK